MVAEYNNEPDFNAALGVGESVSSMAQHDDDDIVVSVYRLEGNTFVPVWKIESDPMQPTEEPTCSFEQVVLESIAELRNAPPTCSESATNEGVFDSRGEIRLRKNEPEPTPLQLRYNEQVRENRTQNWLVNAMSKMVAWTWLPGRNRRTCPGIVDLRDARLLTMDRFPSKPRAIGDRCALTLYRVTVDPSAKALYGGPGNIEMFKDFMLRPHYRAGGIALNSENEEIFRQALALDLAMEQVAKGKIESTETFDPPTILLGFPKNYQPTPEWKGPMQEAVLRTLHPAAPTLQCLRSPGGRVISVTEKDGFRVLEVERFGNVVKLRMPIWTLLTSHVRSGAVVDEGTPLAELPRAVYGRVKDVTSRYSFRSLEWLEDRILDENTEFVSVEESVFDKLTGQRTRQIATWRCLPLFFVAGQVYRSERSFLNLRRHLGRKTHSLDIQGGDVLDIDQHQARIDVRTLDHTPRFSDCKFGDKTWECDLMTTPDDAPWKSKISLRGV